jgi:hypothetical protein
MVETLVPHGGILRLRGSYRCLDNEQYFTIAAPAGQRDLGSGLEADVHCRSGHRT